MYGTAKSQSVSVRGWITVLQFGVQADSLPLTTILVPILKVPITRIQLYYISNIHVVQRIFAKK